MVTDPPLPRKGAVIGWERCPLKGQPCKSRLAQGTLLPLRAVSMLSNYRRHGIQGFPTDSRSSNRLDLEMHRELSQINTVSFI